MEATIYQWIRLRPLWRSSAEVLKATTTIVAMPFHSFIFHYLFHFVALLFPLNLKEFAFSLSYRQIYICLFFTSRKRLDSYSNLKNEKGLFASSIGFPLRLQFDLRKKKWTRTEAVPSFPLSIFTRTIHSLTLVKSCGILFPFVKERPRLYLSMSLFFADVCLPT